MSKIKVTKGRRSPMVMHRDEMERALRSRMKWLLDFLNTDIDSISGIECLKLVLDVAAFIYGPFYEMFPKINLKPKTDLIKEKKFLNICQEHLRFLLRGILTGLKQIGKKPTYGRPANFDTYVAYYWVFISKRNDRVFKTPIDRGDYLLEIPENLCDGQIVDGKFVDEESGLIYRGMLTDALIWVISRFPLSRIKTCQKPDCGNYFFQKTTKSKGDFCSQKCQNWARTNRWRKANPDKYNAYHRKRRNQTKEPWIKMTCLNCGHEYPKRHPDLGVCSKCEGKLKYEVQFLEGREWKSEQCGNYNEAEEFRKEILEFEKNEGRETNGER